MHLINESWYFFDMQRNFFQNKSFELITLLGHQESYHDLGNMAGIESCTYEIGGDAMLSATKRRSSFAEGPYGRSLIS